MVNWRVAQSTPKKNADVNNKCHRMIAGFLAMSVCVCVCSEGENCINEDRNHSFVVLLLFIHLHNAWCWMEVAMLDVFDMTLEDSSISLQSSSTRSFIRLYNSSRSTTNGQTHFRQPIFLYLSGRVKKKPKSNKNSKVFHKCPRHNNKTYKKK